VNRLRVESSVAPTAGSAVEQPEESFSEALAIIGPYGSGKSTMAAQIADIIESVGVRYAAIDLDWLAWYHDQQPHDQGDRSMLHRNLASVVANYRTVGVDRFVVALSLESADDVILLAEAMGMPVRTVELAVPIEEIERRLAADPTTERREDPEEARRWVAESIGSGFAYLTVANDRPVAEVAAEIIEWLGWVA
jgi:thymidylate kinase